MRQTIGRYQIIEHIASGGQATVFRAWDTSTGRVVALKLLHQHLAESGPHLYRFHREARLAAEAAHPNIVEVYEVGRDGDSHFIAMEYLPVSLDDLMRNQRQMPIDRAVDIARQIASGLEAMRVHGVVHRDIKPSNVLIGADGRAKLADFGISRLTEDARLTRTGAVMGTPHYMSPEQARGEASDTRSDLYSQGCVLYQMLAGEVPFDAETPFEVIRKHINEQPRPLREVRPDVPVALQRIVSRCMAKSPARRYQTPLELDAALAKAFPSSNPAAPERAETPANAAGDGGDAVIPIPETPPLGLPPQPRDPWARGLARHVLGRRGAAVAVLAVLLLALGIGAYSMVSREPTMTAGGEWTGVEGGAGLSYQRKVEVVATVHGPASLPLEDKYLTTRLFLHHGDRPDLAGMRVTLPDGRTLTSDRIGADQYYFVDVPGLPQPGDAYKFVGLDKDGRAVPGTDQTVTWESLPVPEPPGNVRAQATPRGIEVTWEGTPPAKYDPRSIYILAVVGQNGKAMFVDSTRVYSSLLVVPQSRAGLPRSKDGRSYSPIEEWADGTYRISVETRVFNGPREATREHWVGDPSQDITVTVVGGAVTSIRNPGDKPTPVATQPTATPTPCPSCRAPDLQAGLIAYWPAEGNANDAAGGHHGALRNGVTFAPGKVGQAFSLGQAFAHVEIVSGNDDFNFQPTQPMSVAMWVKRTYPPGLLSSGGPSTLLGKRTQCRGASGEIHYQMTIDDDATGLYFGSPEGGFVGAGVGVLPSNDWRHLAVTFDGFVFKLYVGGLLKGRPTFGSLQSPNNAPLLIGAAGGCRHVFIGLMDEVRFYNRALSGAEVKALFDAGA